MSILSNLSGTKSGLWKPEAGVEIKILPLGFVDHYEDFVTLEEEGVDIPTKIAAMKRLTIATIKQAVPDVTDDEIKRINLAQMISLLPIIQEVNSVMTEGNKDLIEKVKAMQEKKA